MLAIALILGVSALYGLLCWMLWRYQPRLIFYPTRRLSGSPAAHGVLFESVQIAAGSGVHAGTLDGWWMPAAPEAPIILYLHGNGENIGAYAGNAIRLRQLELSVLIFDYRGYGRSTGPFPNEARVYQDAEAAWHWLTQRGGISPARVFLYGHSLGGAIAIELAIRHPEAAGLMVESSLTAIAQMARRLLVFRALPLRQLIHQKFESIAKVGSLQMPVLFLHGTRDLTVPHRMSQELWAAAPEPKQLVLIPAGNHMDSSAIGGDHYRAAVTGFIRARGFELPNTNPANESQLDDGDTGLPSTGPGQTAPRADGQAPRSSTGSPAAPPAPSPKSAI